MKNPVLGCFLVALILCAFAKPLAKRKLVADKTLSTVTYAAKYPLHDWEGVSHDVNCAMIYNDETKQIESVAVSLKVASFDSKNNNRDSHAMEVLDGLKYPNVTFVSSNVKTGDNGGLTAVGTLTFHGIAKTATLQGMLTESGGKMTVTGEFPVSLTDHKIERPSMMGMKTEDLITLKFIAVFPM